MTPIKLRRAVSFDEFRAASRVIQLHTSLRRKLRYLAFLRVVPVVSALLMPVAILAAVSAWRASGDHVAAFALYCGLAAMCCVYLLYPWIYWKSVRRSYRAQRLDVIQTLTLSEAEIHIVIPDCFESRVAWSFYELFMETEDRFLIFNQRGLFIVVAKAELDAGQWDEVRALLAAQLKRVQ